MTILHTLKEGKGSDRFQIIATPEPGTDKVRLTVQWHAGRMEDNEAEILFWPLKLPQEEVAKKAQEALEALKALIQVFWTEHKQE